MLTRTWIVALVLALALAYVRVSARNEIPMSASLDAVPLTLGEWSGVPAAELDADTRRVLGADAYIDRVYTSAKGGAPLGLFVGFYGQQRQGDAIHSPLNCLPGTGWATLNRGRLNVPLAAGSIEVNRLVVEKSFERYLVLYWYEGRGRAVASEYTNKLLLLVDAMRFNRTDGAIVRVMTPVRTSSDAVAGDALAFIRTVYPALRRHLPGAPD